MEDLTISIREGSIADWLKHASPDELHTALEFGIPAVCKLNSMIAVNSGKKASESRVVQQTSVGKGIEGESMVEELLNKHFGNVENVSKSSKSGDLTLFLRHRKITVEVKNYSNPVPSAGVEKFQRDLSTTNACGGVFISLNTSITNVTSDFTIRYEFADTKTIPAAYIVSSSESAIVIAINMISQIISSVDYINAEIYSKDKVLSGVYSMADQMDLLSKSRNDLQLFAGEITSQIIKTSLNMARAETVMRQGIDAIRGELFHVQLPDTGPALAALETIPNFSKLPLEIKSYVGGVMKAVQETHHRQEINGSAWKISAKKCTNNISGIGFNFLTNKVEVYIPRTKIPSELIIGALNTFGKKVNVGDTLSIELDKITHEWICNMLRPRDQ